MSGPQVHAGGRVVVGVDGSPSSMQAAVHGAECARRRGVGLLLVHLTPHGSGDEARPMAGREVQERFGRSADRLVQAAADHVRETTGFADVTASVVEDHPVDGLLALSLDAALLVTGRRGTGGLPGLILGSTAGALVQHARCPVIALPDESEVDAAAPSVVVGVEGRPGDEQVLAFAVAEAAARSVVLRAVHAWRDVPLESALGGFGPLVDWSAVEEQERALLAEAVAPWRTEAPDVRIEEEVLRDGPATALLGASAGAELLVVGHRHRSRLARLGSTTHGVLHRAAAPIAVVPILP
jgi:nucleotide-binding universal stress UspA family protein